MGEALAQRGCAFQMAISRTVLPVGHVSHLALDRVCSSRTTSNALECACSCGKPETARKVASVTSPDPVIISWFTRLGETNPGWPRNHRGRA